MGQLDRVKEAQRAVREAALQRWQERAPQREQNRQDLAERGVGAADSPNRNARYQAREAAFEKARALRSIGRLPMGLERKMGPTLDWTPYAPSDGARAAGRPVARVVTLRGQDVQPEGFATAFMVTSRLLMTNHHVFPSKIDAHGTAAHFLYEQGDRGIANGVLFEVDPDSFFLSYEKLDLAVVAVKPKSLNGQPISAFGSLPLIEATPKILVGQRVNIIQHPEGGPKRYATDQNRLIDLLDLGYLHYETDTLQGSSGSPAFSQDWQLVGLHHASIPEMRDGKVIAVGGGLWEESMGDDRVHWIANEGVRVSSIVKYLGGVKMDDAKKQEMLDELMASTADPIDELASISKPPEPDSKESTPVGRSSPPGGNNSFNFSAPVTIHVYAPNAAPVAAHALPPIQPVIAPRTEIAVEKVIRFDPNYKQRKGYDPNFLDPDRRFRVPVPTVDSSRAHEILKDKNGKPLVLKYHHFELVMNEQRYMQMWSAVNVDYDPELKLKGDRKSFGSDKWIADPRIPGELQIQDAEFYKPAGNIDRGHIVRREDNAWGATPEEIEFANSDTFHWPNCTPQHEAFNQSNPARNDSTYKGMKGLWGDFENHVQQNLGGEDTRACILAGPVLADKDPSQDFGYGKIQYPLEFWKVIAVATAQNGARRLTVFGFRLSQRNVVKEFGIEKFVPGKFKKYQVSLARITQLTGVVFDPSLHAADVMRGEVDDLGITDGREVRGVRGGRAAADPMPQPGPARSPNGALRRSARKKR